MAVELLCGARATETVPALSVSLNGVSADYVRQRMLAGEYLSMRQGSSVAVVSFSGASLVIEAVEGAGGTRLAREIVDSARAAGVKCRSWVLCRARARLAARAGMHLTGNVRVSSSGKLQYEVTS